ncbi:hypothetical protein ITI46_25310 [Streptomyces oryzae]|uniref:DUF8094 domain-containing protein n=1 Tax=Streptomyces oryzae TaxID=1434886 RepID=A0ABS3XIY1_9ACTN|nr:hypothetical protein [Streptomyces oryzae]MBO8194947.1 hypothetical protein [Streptomyces oryzae]
MAVLLAGTAAGCGGWQTRDRGGAAGGARDARGARDGDGRTGRSPGPRGAVTLAQARRVLHRYEKIATRADRTRDAELLAKVAAGNVLERSKAGYRQYDALSRHDRAPFAHPTRYRKPTFHIPAGTSWFLVTATRTAPTPQETVLVFAGERRAGGGNQHPVGSWRLHAALPLQAGRLPRIATTRAGLATEADTGSRSGALRPNDVPGTYEDLWQTGGDDEAAALAPNAVTKEARSTYLHRDDELGAEGARRRFVPVRPRHRDSYALRTADGGVLAVVPLAHEQRLSVTRPGLQLTPSDEEAVYDPAPRSTVVSTFHGQALAHLPRNGRPAVLSAKYALVDSR